jgi:hypothetical protein
MISFAALPLATRASASLRLVETIAARPQPSTAQRGLRRTVPPGAVNRAGRR